MNRYTASLLMVALVSCLTVLVLRKMVFPESQWWNLIMIVCLVVALVAYLWRARNRRQGR